MKKIMIILCILSIFLIVPVVQATIYHVDPNGNDANVGSEERPFKTIQKGVDKAVAGDMVLVKPGQYPEVVITKANGQVDKPIIIKALNSPVDTSFPIAAPNRLMSATAKSTVQGFEINHQYTTIQGFDIHGFRSMWKATININSGGSYTKILENHIRDGYTLFRNDILLHTGDTLSLAGGSIKDELEGAGFKTGDFISIIFKDDIVDPEIDKIRGGFWKIISMDAGSITLYDQYNASRPDSLRHLPERGPLTARFLLNAYGISSSAHDVEIKQNVFSNLMGNVINLGSSSYNHVIEGNMLEKTNGWDLFRPFGHHHIIRNNFSKDSPALPVLGNHPDIIQVWGDHGIGESQDITFEHNFMMNLETQLGQLNGNWNRKVRNWKFINNVFYNIEANFNNTLPDVQLINNTYYKTGSVGGTLDTAYVRGWAENMVFKNNAFVALGSEEMTYSEYGGSYQFLPADYAKTNQVGYNFIAGHESADFNSKPNFPYQQDPYTINGGDPMFTDLEDPLGPDRRPFTSDDGMIPLPNSPLCTNGEGGKHIGAYGCKECTAESIFADFTSSADSRTVYAFNKIIFDASKRSSSCGRPATYVWDFGDGTKSSEKTSTHRYTNAGTYNVRLTVTDSNNRTASRTKVIKISSVARAHMVLGINGDNSVADWSGKGLNGAWMTKSAEGAIISGNPSYYSGKINQAIALQGTDSYVVIKDRANSGLDGMQQLTISFWAQKNDKDINGLIKEAGSLILTKSFAYSMSVNAKGVSGTIFFEGQRLDVSTDNTFIISPINYDTAWHHYAMTYDGINARLFIDGKQVGIKQALAQSIFTPLKVSSRDMVIGKDPFSKTAKSFYGSIDEIRIYSIAMSAGDIAKLALAQEVDLALNQSPTAQPQILKVTQNQPSPVILNAMDAEDDVDSLVYIIVDLPQKGVLSGNNRQWTYTPTNGYLGSDKFTYKVRDQGGLVSNTVSVDIVVVEPNVAPDAVMVTNIQNGRAPLTVNFDASQSTDKDGTITQYAWAFDDNKFTTATGITSSFTYTIGGNYKAKLTVTDNKGTTSSSTVIINVGYPNQAPVAYPISVSVTEDVPTTIELWGRDVENSSLTYRLVEGSGPNRGKLSGNLPNMTYTPNVEYVGSDTFKYIVSDGEFDSPPATVSINVTMVNDAPVISDISNQYMVMGSMHSLDFTLTDVDTALDKVTLSMSSSNVNLIDTTGMSITGTGSLKTIKLLPKVGKTGSTTITITASEGNIKTQKSFILTVTSSGQGIMGDVSGDNKVTMYDAARVLRYTLGSALSDAQKQKADMNADGKIDGSDVLAIGRKALGL